LTPTRLNELSATLNSLSLPIALIHSGELVERRDENDLKVYRYLFNDIGKTLALTIKLAKDDRIAAFELVEVKSSSQPAKSAKSPFRRVEWSLRGVESPFRPVESRLSSGNRKTH